jgi:peptidoglycan/xylan/chitin deacetylase (PgdA/CDA1 family)
MLRRSLTVSLFCMATLTQPCFAETREIAITIDDLPFVGASYKNEAALKRTHDRFMRIVQSLVDNQAPAVGFVIGGAIGQGDSELLEAFHHAGLIIGNHTYSHLNLNQTPAEKYIAGIAKTDQRLTPLLSHPKYFRYPYLAEGRGETKPMVQQYLAENDYVIAPVTIDSKDYRFNEELYHVAYRAREQYIPQLKRRYLDYIWHETEKAEQRAHGKPVKQILLLHANILNSYCLNDILLMYKAHGYRFITLSEALVNPAPALVVTPKQETADGAPANTFSYESEPTAPPRPAR